MNEMELLKEKYREIEARLKKIEAELGKSLKKDLNDNAIEERNREVLNDVYQIEKDNITRINEVIKKHLTQ
ncbi:MAG: hypothetical protein LW878_03970 [Proteobacteria bacterium]|jgi:hypothetical protein|nr:hypothetical protein [Pseudomonadota bacterium]